MNKLLKKLLAVSLCAALLGGTAAALPAVMPETSIRASATGTYGDFEYEVNDDNTITITKYNGSVEKVAIPKKINGKKVTNIGEYSFYSCDEITDITIPEGVISIEESAFENCSNLKSIIIPNGVSIIEENMFSDCINLTNVTIPDSVSVIKGYAFKNCSSLSSIDLPDSITDIGDWAFSGCSGLVNIKLPEKIKIIGEDSFSDCAGLTSIIIPQGVTVIESEAFCGCSKLENVSIPDSVTQISSYAFFDCQSLKKITIPDSVEEIEDFAIGYYFFWNKTAVTNFTIYGKTGSVAEEYANDNDFKFVKVNEINVTKISLNKTTLSLDIGGSTTLTATLNPANATDKTVTWFTSDKSVATVKNGKITAVGAGTCTIYAKSSNGKKASCTVNVVSPLYNTSVVSSEIVQVGDKVRVSASANGGAGGYTYAYYYKRSSNNTWKTLGTEFGTTSSVSFTPTAEADFDVKVIVKDSKGTTAEKLFTVKAVKELALTNVSVLQRTSIKLGSAIPMIGKAVGGTAPYTYAFYFKRSTNTNWKLLGDKFGTAATARLKPTASGEYDIRIDVKDSNGTVIKKFLTATVK